MAVIGKRQHWEKNLALYSNQENAIVVVGNRISYVNLPTLLCREANFIFDYTEDGIFHPLKDRLQDPQITKAVIDEEFGVNTTIMVVNRTTYSLRVGGDDQMMLRLKFGV